MVHEFKSHIGLCVDSVEPTWDSLSSLSTPPCLHSLSQKQINIKKKKVTSFAIEGGEVPKMPLKTVELIVKDN